MCCTVEITTYINATNGERTGFKARNNVISILPDSNFEKSTFQSAKRFLGVNLCSGKSCNRGEKEKDGIYIHSTSVGTMMVVRREKKNDDLTFSRDKKKF